jgi:flagellar motility protein MotE (MotC chaperone)
VGFLSGMFVIILAGIAADVIVKIARARGAGGGSAVRADLAALQRQLDEQAETIANQSQRLQELEERFDFAERLLAQRHDRNTLGPDRPS